MSVEYKLIGDDRTEIAKWHPAANQISWDLINNKNEKTCMFMPKEYVHEWQRDQLRAIDTDRPLFESEHKRVNTQYSDLRRNINLYGKRYEFDSDHSEQNFSLRQADPRGVYAYENVPFQNMKELFDVRSGKYKYQFKPRSGGPSLSETYRTPQRVWSDFEKLKEQAYDSTYFWFEGERKEQTPQKAVRERNGYYFPQVDTEIHPLLNDEIEMIPQRLPMVNTEVQLGYYSINDQRLPEPHHVVNPRTGFYTRSPVCDLAIVHMDEDFKESKENSRTKRGRIHPNDIINFAKQAIYDVDNFKTSKEANPVTIRQQKELVINHLKEQLQQIATVHKETKNGNRMQTNRSNKYDFSVYDGTKVRQSKESNPFKQNNRLNSTRLSTENMNIKGKSIVNYSQRMKERKARLRDVEIYDHFVKDQHQMNPIKASNAKYELNRNNFVNEQYGEESLDNEIYQHAVSSHNMTNLGKKVQIHEESIQPRVDDDNKGYYGSSRRLGPNKRFHNERELQDYREASGI